MLPSSSKVANFLLSGLLVATSSMGIASQTARAETATAPTKPKAEPQRQDKQSTEADLIKAPATASGSNKKAQKSSTTPVRIKPFIQADAIALGQWLVVKSVKTLVSKPSANGAKPTTTAQANKKTDGQTNSATAKPASATKPSSNSISNSPTKAQPAQPAPVPQAPPTPKVAVSALPPEPSENPTIDGYTEMRVALTKQASAVTVAASQGGAIVSTSGDLIESLPASVGYQISANERGLFVNGQPIPTAAWLEPDGGYVAVGDRWYRGRLLLLWQNGGVMAVNYVMLQDYLYSVVGAEMSASWSIEALKAQAVAARSYAIVHTVRHQRRAYDLDDTQRYQAYKGIATEASSTQQAVHATAGEFISYGGGVVESLYAANQDIVNDAHSGYGMSQTGALDLAEQGYLYYEILSAYYPDTSVGRIDVSN